MRLPVGWMDWVWSDLLWQKLTQQTGIGQIPLRYPDRKTWSQTWFPTSRRQVQAISTCRDSLNLVADQFAAGFRPAFDQLSTGLRHAHDTHVCDLGRPNSIKLSSSPADHRPARELRPARDPARELVADSS